ncbi:MAG TPA: MASE1 domain-containing protein, partial [Burkholderiales bacterium]|nr:MASE1 domain-containing protein [Burkholderiales bacterium]
MLSVMPEGNALFWPANAVTLAALLRFDGARLPAIGLVVLAAEVAADVPRFSVMEALLFGIINFAEAAGAFVLLRRVRFHSAFTAVADVWKFVLAAIAASGCAAFLGAAVYSAFRGAETTYFEFMRIWWFGDAVGLIVVTPLLLGFPPFRTMA